MTELRRSTIPRPMFYAILAAATLLVGNACSTGPEAQTPGSPPAAESGSEATGPEATGSEVAGPDAGGTEAGDLEQIARGRVSYRIYCLNCHGDNGAGQGPMAELLKIRPADLTRIAGGDGGAFPAERVYRTIDGRDEVGTHGRRDMPVWGIGLQDLSRDAGQEEAVREQIRDLVVFIESLQVP